MSFPARARSASLTVVLALAGAHALADGKSLEAVEARLAKTAKPETVAAEVPAEALADVRALNGLRLKLKAGNKAAAAQALFGALAKRKPTEAVLLNQSLAYVDQLMGKNLLQQGNLSTRSQEICEQIIKRDKNDWTAWYIRGLNNLYWPDWFGKAAPARDYLAEAVAIHQRLLQEQQEQSDRYALGYLALGDAHALLDQPAEAKKTWAEGRTAYPHFPELGQRLAIADAELHAKVRALRDANQPIDTDLSFLWAFRGPAYRIDLTGGTLYGPGPLDDQALKPGSLVNLYLAGAFNGHIPAFNNGKAEPNLPGEILQGKTVDGLLSDGTEANENVDVGFVSLMKGKFNLFLAAVQDGPNQGQVNYFLDDGWHWTIRDDIGIDPGFPVGVVKFREFTFSTSPRVLPLSRQTEANNPGGVDRSGSVASGAVVPGNIGDANFDGKLDGMMNAIGRFPFESVILPGAPFAQTRELQTDIPVTAAQAALLTTANALSYLKLAMDNQAKQPELAATLRKTYGERMELARKHAERAAEATPPLSDAARRTIAELPAGAGEAELCEARRMLETAAPEQGLRRRDFNASGIKMTCTP